MYYFEPLNKTITYTHLGSKKAVSSKAHSDGDKYYTKSNLSNQEIDNFIRLGKLGIGIPIVKCTKSIFCDGKVLMYGGISLQKILDKRMISEATKAVTELPQIYEILKKNNIAHCDIKPSNIVYKYERYFLIDNDDMVSFGAKRKVGTPGVNCEMYKLFGGEITDANTDYMGFKYTLNKVYELCSQ